MTDHTFSHFERQQAKKPPVIHKQIGTDDQGQHAKNREMVAGALIFSGALIVLVIDMARSVNDRV